MKSKWIIGISPGSKRIRYLNPTPLSLFLWNYWSVIWAVGSFASSEVPKVTVAFTALPAPAAQVFWAVHGAWWAVCSPWSQLWSSPCARVVKELHVPLDNNGASGTFPLGQGMLFPKQTGMDPKLRASEWRAAQWVPSCCLCTHMLPRMTTGIRHIWPENK